MLVERLTPACHAYAPPGNRTAPRYLLWILPSCKPAGAAGAQRAKPAIPTCPALGRYSQPGLQHSDMVSPPLRDICASNSNTRNAIQQAGRTSAGPHPGHRARLDQAGLVHWPVRLGCWAARSVNAATAVPGGRVAVRGSGGPLRRCPCHRCLAGPG